MNEALSRETKFALVTDVDEIPALFSEEECSIWGLREPKLVKDLIIGTVLGVSLWDKGAVSNFPDWVCAVVLAGLQREVDPTVELHKLMEFLFASGLAVIMSGDQGEVVEVPRYVQETVRRLMHPDWNKIIGEGNA